MNNIDFNLLFNVNSGMIHNNETFLDDLKDKKLSKVVRQAQKFAAPLGSPHGVMNDAVDITIVAGPTKVGKTTVANMLAKSSQFQNAEYLASTRQALRSFPIYKFKNGKYIIETLLTSVDQREYVRDLKNSGTHLRMVFVSVYDPFISIDRAMQYELAGGSGCSAEVLFSRYYKSLAACIAMMPFYDELIVVENSAYYQAPKAILRFVDNIYVEGDISSLPKWAKLFINNDIQNR